MTGYFEPRSGLAYYAAVRRILETLGPRESILDVGCWDTPVATWGAFTRRYGLDTRRRPEIPDVTAVYGQWPQAAEILRQKISVVTCLQVVEHITDARPFCEALFTAAEELVIISVPYRWTTGAELRHVHDPIDEEKLANLVGRDPDATQIVRDGHLDRMIAQYRITRQSASQQMPRSPAVARVSLRPFLSGSG